ncbi:hypothetical protein ERJ70_04745 [Sediminibacillus dalangtanensis]|uniref:Uncharacterized protein n=1 Tax=Sediminibacillus dalangtanensis TaxID=2729421 RepID=A0ABX7VS92_9BACI|nr:hypothetical protein [Sediminibacillus dalangtanensis]QTM98665.1 hypothetical protein ERJ70_04745 [Sediminibacillus dalangtanensis]
MTKMKTERFHHSFGFFDEQKANFPPYEKCHFHSGKVLRFPRARLQLTWQSIPLCQVDLQLALIPLESAHLAFVEGDTFSSGVISVLPITVTGRKLSCMETAFLCHSPISKKIKDRHADFSSSSLFRYLSTNRRIRSILSLLGGHQPTKT